MKNNIYVCPVCNSDRLLASPCSYSRNRSESNVVLFYSNYVCINIECFFLFLFYIFLNCFQRLKQKLEE